MSNLIFIDKVADEPGDTAREYQKADGPDEVLFLLGDPIQVLLFDPNSKWMIHGFVNNARNEIHCIDAYDTDCEVDEPFGVD